MITNSDATVAVSNLGWVDHGSIWRFDSPAMSARSVELSDAAYLQVGAGSADLFSAVHHFAGQRLPITVQSFAEPERQLAAVEVSDWSPRVSGDPRVWDHVDAAYVGYLGEDATGAAGYFMVRVAAGAATLIRLDWFGANYDHDYQGVVAVSVLPETGELVFGVARSSELVLCDGQAEVSRMIPLAGRHGNPSPYVRKSAAELWAIDYDTVVRIDRHTWNKTGELLGQHAQGGQGQFLGEMHFSPDERCVLVSRPFSGDVLHLDTQTLTCTATSTTGGQPLTAALLSTDRIVARDWKTGQTLLEQSRSS
ncbi:MAG: hypothetical protein QOI76_4040 [Frankiales bacterium]|nr:hypothetical protein [Frankiales bacterium]